MMKASIKQIGATLIEVLITLAILAAGFVMLIKFQGDLTRSTVGINQQLEATTLARDKIDELRHYTVINTTPGFIAYNDIVSGSAVVTRNNATYTVTWTVTTNSNPSHKIVQVAVTWTDQANQAQSVNMETVIGEVDPLISGNVVQGL